MRLFTAARAHGAAWRLMAVALACAGGLALGCGQNRSGTILTPSGEILLPAIGAISGKVDFGDGTHPATLVMIARVSDVGCTSAFTSFQVLGTFTAWNEATSPLLTQLAPCVWVDTLSIIPGAIEWKFRGDQNWSNQYGTSGTAVDGLVGCAVRAGSTDNLKATSTFSGPVVAVVEEGRTCTRGDGSGGTPYSFQAIGAAGAPAVYASTSDGRFTLRDLVPGRYNVLVRPPGRAPRTIADVIVGEGTNDLGTISFGMAATGGITGTIAFDPGRYPDLSSPPWQPVTVKLKQGTVEVATFTTTRTDLSFAFNGLSPGTYKVVADANIFRADSLDGILVANAVVPAGTITLLRNTLEIATSLHVAGDFNTFALTDPWKMAQGSNVIWTLTSPATITAGVKNLKFVTDASFDNPTDYGGDETVTIDVPATGLATRLVGGTGTALHLNFASDGVYKFTLDERRQSFSIEAVPAPRSARKP